MRDRSEGQGGLHNKSAISREWSRLRPCIRVHFVNVHVVTTAASLLPASLGSQCVCVWLRVAVPTDNAWLATFASGDVSQSNMQASQVGIGWWWENYGHP